MATYQTSLKVWGSTGSEYPDNYNYVEGDQPVDAWDNFFNAEVISNIQTIVSALNNDVLQTDGSNALAANLDIGQNALNDVDKIDNIDDIIVDIDSDASQTTATLQITHDAQAETLLKVDESGAVTVPNGTFSNRGARIDQDMYQKQEGGTVEAGDMVVIGQFNLADGQTLNVQQAVLSEDGFTTPADSGIDLIIAFDGDVDSTDTVTVLGGDGTTLFDDEEGNPLASRTNSSGAAVTAAIAIDNGHFNAGTGVNTQAYGGYNAYIA